MHDTDRNAKRVLNDSQLAFCNAGNAVRLLAPAGCGKTQSILWRCLHLAEREANERSRFLLFTFTRAASDELRDRIRTDRTFAAVAGHVTVTTLNSWGYRRLKSVKHSLQLKTSKTDRYFTLNNVLQPVWSEHPRIESALTDSRSKHRVSHALMELIDELKTLGFRHDRVETEESFRQHVGYLEECGMNRKVADLVNDLVELEILPELDDPLAAVYRHFVPFWRAATQRLYDSAIISLEDQKYWALIDLEQQKEKKTFWSGAARYQHILVDEFQDINPLDLGLLRAIAAINKADLTIVGDDDQAIYEWRAASPSFILDPKRHIDAEYETVVLDTNYRSPKNIVELSQRLIAHNKRRVPKKVSAASEKNAIVELQRVPNLTAAIDYVLDLVKKLLASDDCKNVAIIGRKRSQIIPYQIVFASKEIPFYAAEDLHVFLSDAFDSLKELLAIRARADIASSMFGGSPVKDLLKLCDLVKRYPLRKTERESLRAHLTRAAPRTLRAALAALQTYTGPMKGSNEGGRMTESFVEAIVQLLESKTVSTSIAALSEHFDGLKKDYGKAIEDIFYTDPPFLYLAEYAQRYGDDYGAFSEDMERAIATLAKIPPEDVDDSEQGWKMPLHLMTALRAKGKEFDAVIILDANEDVWPSKLAQTEFQLEAERRVFYVAMTRAKKHLVFLVNDFLLDEAAAPTRYLTEMGLLRGPEGASRRTVR